MRAVLAVILGSIAGSFAQNCSEVLAPLQLNDSAAMVAHATHSLTLNMIRHYFNPDTEAENGIATVNLDRREENHLHEHAQLISLENSLDHPAFFALDCLLSNLDNKKYGIKNANFKDRIAHDLHMHHMWQTASEFYHQLVDNPPEDDICSCFLDSIEEEMMRHLNLIAKEIRIPNQLSVGRAYYLGRYIGRYLGRYIGFYSRSADNHLDLYKNNIKNERTWQEWKEMMKDPYDGYHEDMGWNMAYYMYCKLN